MVKTKLSIRKEESEENTEWLSRVANTTKSYFLLVFCKKERASSMYKFTYFDNQEHLEHYNSAFESVEDFGIFDKILVIFENGDVLEFNT